MLDSYALPPPGRRWREPRKAQPAYPSGLPEARVVGHRSQSALELGYHETAGAGQVDLLLSLRDPRRLQPLCRWLDDCRPRGKGTGQAVHRRNLRQGGDRPRATHPPRRSWFLDDLQARCLLARRSRRDQDPQPPTCLKRQSVLGESVQDPEVPAGVPGPLRLPARCTEFLPGVLLLVQHRAPSFRSWAADPRGGPHPARRTGTRTPSTDARPGLCRPPRTFRPEAPTAARAAYGGLDQPATEV